MALGSRRRANSLIDPLLSCRIMGTGIRHYPRRCWGTREGCMRWPLWRVAVAEQSMEPGLRPGDWLLVRRTTRPARRGQSRPGRRTRIRLGRTARIHLGGTARIHLGGTARIRLGGTARIRLGGTARIRPGQVVIARHPDRPDMLLVKRAVRQESGGWWLDSDNPNAGAVDSRRFGPVPPELIEGLVLLRYRRARRASR